MYDLASFQFWTLLGLTLGVVLASAGYVFYAFAGDN